MFRLGEDRLTPALLVDLALSPNPNVFVSETAWSRLERFRGIVDDVLKQKRRVYGINTGFGYLSDITIDESKLSELQENLIRSHACGVGEMAPPEFSRALLLLRAHTFLLGHSGISRRVVETILECLRHDILPLVPEQGSVGASGDLAPLAHLAMGLMAEGEVIFQGEQTSAETAFAKAGVVPVRPLPKEGLALINGTQFMTIIASFAVVEARELAKVADTATAMSLDAIRGSVRAFKPELHTVRPQPGQAIVAANLMKIFAENDDEIMASHAECSRVQDPYSFRCTPQVHGASRDALDYVERVVETELNSVTDNPVVLDEGDIVSGGNFHGQPVALAMDFLAIAVAELGSIAERRVEKLTNPNLSGLPAFIIQDSGLNSGYMIPHVVCAALVSENKIYCHPASVDSIPTSADKEDHVSMGPIAARKARKVIGNVRNILAIELLAAAQGIELLAPLKPGKALQPLLSAIRERSAFMRRDRSLHKDIKEIEVFIAQGGVTAAVSRAGIALH